MSEQKNKKRKLQNNSCNTPKSYSIIDEEFKDSKQMCEQQAKALGIKKLQTKCDWVKFALKK